MILLPFFSKQSDALTKIEVDLTLGVGQTTWNGSLENEIDNNGGSRVSNYIAPTYSGTTVTITPTILIPWESRYNYRLGFANVYTITAIRLYKKGVLEETQSGVPLVAFLQYTGLAHSGFNLNPSNRVLSVFPNNAPQNPYPK